MPFRFGLLIVTVYKLAAVNVAVAYTVTYVVLDTEPVQSALVDALLGDAMLHETPDGRPLVV